MIHNQLESPQRGRARARIVASATLGVIACAILALGHASREPLRPLQAYAKWRLERRGARFAEHDPSRRQGSLNDCGPTALAELLELTGRIVPPVDSLRKLTGLRPSGTRLGDLASAAGKVGLPLLTVRWDPTEIAQLPLPSLVWVERSHFVVIARRPHPDSVEVRDPAAGMYRMAEGKFGRIWTGEAVILVDSLVNHRAPGV